MANDSVNYSQYTHKRISKLKHLSEEQKAELLKEMTLSDYELKNKKSVDKEKKSSTSKDASDYLEYYDNKLNKKEETFKYNEKGTQPSRAQEEEKEEDTTVENMPQDQKEWLVKMYFTLQQRHKNYEEDKKGYTKKQLAVVEKMEKETEGKMKFVVDKNFIKTFNKMMGVDYRGSAIFGNLVVVSDHKDLEDETLLRHEAIHCKQQRDMANLLGFPLLIAGKPGRITADHIGMASWLLLSLISKTVKQFTGKERFTPSAVDYGTDNQATDLETYINQFDPEYLSKRKRYSQIKHFLPGFMQKKFKKIREQELQLIKDKITDIEQQQKQGKKISFEEEDTLKTLKNNLKQFEKMVKYLENDKETHTVLVEPDVLPSRKHKDSTDYDPNAQVWTESKTNKTKRIKIEKNLQKNMRQKLEAKKDELKEAKGNEKKEKEIRKEIESYEKFLEKTKGNTDKNRRRMKKLKAEELEERKQERAK